MSVPFPNTGRNSSNAKKISNILGFKRNTIIKWKRNNFINDIFDIKFYIDKEWKNQSNINNTNNNNAYQIKANLNNNLNNNSTNYIYNLRNHYFKSDLILNDNGKNINNNIADVYNNTIKDYNLYGKTIYRSKSPD